MDTHTYYICNEHLVYHHVQAPYFICSHIVEHLWLFQYLVILNNIVTIFVKHNCLYFNWKETICVSFILINLDLRHFKIDFYFSEVTFSTHYSSWSLCSFWGQVRAGYKYFLFCISFAVKFELSKHWPEIASIGDSWEYMCIWK